MDINVSEQYKQEAYDLIRSIYKFIPYYNQIKGTYLGMQFILNMMGLCATITELWAPRTNLENFSDDATFFREDEIFATRRFIEDVGKSNVKDYFLTSRFDVDINYKTGISLAEFNGMANTIIDVIMKIRPVTRCLRRLYYLLIINTDIHFNYLLENSGYDADELNDFGVEKKVFNYIWNITGNPQAYKTDFNTGLNQLNRIFVPWLALDALYIPAKKTEPYYDYDARTHTLKNTYFNLFELDMKLRKSQQKTFRFKMYVREKETLKDVKSELYVVNIGTDVDFEIDRNGFFINFKGAAKTLLNKFFVGTNFNTHDIFLTTSFSIFLGTKYLFQEDVPLDWNIQDLMNEYSGLIAEVSSKYDPLFLLSEKGDVILTYETDNYSYTSTLQYVDDNNKTFDVIYQDEETTAKLVV